MTLIDIYRIEDDARVFVEQFEELNAPHVTIGGHLLALKNETGLDHIAEYV